MIDLEKEGRAKYFDKNGIFKIGIGGDVHLGKLGADVDGFIKFLETKYPKFLVGDLIEGIAPTDKRYSQSEHGGFSITKALSELEAILKQYNTTIWGVMKGNHEETLFKTIGNFYEEPIKLPTGKLAVGGICSRTDIRYMGDMAYIVLKYKGKQLKLQLMHPYKGNVAYKTGEPKRIDINEQLKTKNLQAYITDADFYACAHFHILKVNKPDRVKKLIWDDKKNNLTMGYSYPEDPRWYCLTGSFAKNYILNNRDGDYSEQWKVKPSDLGWIELQFNKDMQIVDVVERFTDAI